MHAHDLMARYTSKMHICRSNRWSEVWVLKCGSGLQGQTPAGSAAGAGTGAGTGAGMGTGGAAPAGQTGRAGSANMGRAESTGKKKGMFSFYH